MSVLIFIVSMVLSYFSCVVGGSLPLVGYLICCYSLSHCIENLYIKYKHKVNHSYHKGKTE